MKHAHVVGSDLDWAVVLGASAVRMDRAKIRAPPVRAGFAGDIK